MGKDFSSEGKVRNFEETGEANENHKKTGKVREFQTNDIYYLNCVHLLFIVRDQSIVEKKNKTFKEY